MSLCWTALIVYIVYMRHNRMHTSKKVKDNDKTAIMFMTPYADFKLEGLRTNRFSGRIRTEYLRISTNHISVEYTFLSHVLVMGVDNLRKLASFIYSSFHLS
jgi:membrane-bound acyltransferase YfiQ involved in biofilm formation